MKISKSEHYDVKITRDKKKNIVDICIIPKHPFPLFRFRKIDKYTTQQLIDDVVFATTPSTFNDPYDSTMIFKEKAIKTEIRHYFENNVNNHQYFLRAFSKVKPSIKTIKSLIDYIYTFVISSIQGKEIFNIAISSLSLTINQEIMWTHYADNSTGFALEYLNEDLDNLAGNKEKNNVGFINTILQNNKICPALEEESRLTPRLLPVIYRNEKHDFSWFYIESTKHWLNSILENNEILFQTDVAHFLSTLDMENENKLNNASTNIFIQKKPEWAYEHEWRLFTYNTNMFVGEAHSPYVEVGTLTPKAIYLGEKIRLYDQIALIEIGKRKKIMVYKMKSKIKGNTIDLCPEILFKP